MNQTWLTVVVVLLVGVVGWGLCDDKSADIEVVGLGENCGESSVCDDKSHLVCVKFQCHCNSGKGFTLDDDGVKCILAESSDEFFHYDLDDDDDDASSNESNEDTAESDETEWKLQENNTEKAREKKDDASPVQVKPDIDTNAQDVPPQVIEQDNKNKDNDIPQMDEGKQVQALESKETVPEEEVKKTEQIKVEEPKNGPNHDDEDYEPFFGEDDDVFGRDNADAISSEKHDNQEGGHCKQDSDCSTSKFGALSRCVQTDSSCECHDTDNKNRTTILVDGTCFIWRDVDSECSSHEECDAVISGPAWCHTDRTTGSSFCTCRPFHVWDEIRKECLPYATQGIFSPCVNSDQCTALEALGPLSKCSEITAKCECMPALGPKAKPVVIFEDKCVELRELGDACSTDQECQASLGASANCHPFTMTCSCKPGHFCNKMLIRPAMSGFTMLVLIAISVSVFLGSVFCLVFKRHARGESYKFIAQNEA